MFRISKFMITFVNNLQDMNQRLQQFLNAENISQAQLADSLGVARAGISHIIAGRNKPGFDFIENMARLYPALNLEWLITGKGKMYKSAKMTDDRSDDLFAAVFAGENAPETVQTTMPEREEKPLTNPLNVSIEHTVSHSISKVIIFFDDGTYQEVK